MTPTTRRLRETSVIIVDSHIPAGMTIAEYRRSRGKRESAASLRSPDTRGATDVVTRRVSVRAGRG